MNNFEYVKLLRGETIVLISASMLLAGRFELRFTPTKETKDNVDQYIKETDL